MSQSVLERYTSADRAEKARIRKTVRDQREDAIRSLDLETVARLTEVLDSLTTTRERTETDYAGAIAQHLANLREAVRQIESGNVDLPEGVEVDFDNLPESDSDEDAVTRLASVKFGTKAPNTEPVPAQVRRAVEAGGGEWVKVSQIVAHEGNTSGSGAVAASLKSDKAHQVYGAMGIEIGQDAKGNLAARKA